MLEKPDLPDEQIITCLREEYGLVAVQIAFLPLGADRNTAVYRVIAADETPYFVKLRRSDFDEVAVALPKYLRDQDIEQIIAPVATLTGSLWAGGDIVTGSATVISAMGAARKAAKDIQETFVKGKKE